MSHICSLRNTAFVCFGLCIYNSFGYPLKKSDYASTLVSISSSCDFPFSEGFSGSWLTLLNCWGLYIANVCLKTNIAKNKLHSVEHYYSILHTLHTTCVHLLGDFAFWLPAIHIKITQFLGNCQRKYHLGRHCFLSVLCRRESLGSFVCVWDWNIAAPQWLVVNANGVLLLTPI